MTAIRCGAQTCQYHLGGVCGAKTIEMENVEFQYGNYDPAGGGRFPDDQQFCRTYEWKKAGEIE